MSQQLGYTKASLENLSGYGVSGQAVNFIASEIVPRSAADASGIRYLYLVQQGGDVDNNNAIIRKFEVGVGWTIVDTLDDATVAETVDYVGAEFPNIASYTALTDTEFADLQATILAYPLEP